MNIYTRIILALRSDEHLLRCLLGECFTVQFVSEVESCGKGQRDPGPSHVRGRRA